MRLSKLRVYMYAHIDEGRLLPYLNLKCYEPPIYTSPSPSQIHK